jgi:hypothetical protein
MVYLEKGTYLLEWVLGSIDNSILSALHVLCWESFSRVTCMNSEYIIDVRYYTWLNIWSFIEYNILWSTSQWVFCCFARGSAGASLLNSNLRLACESLHNIWNVKMLELSFPFSRFTNRNIEIFQKPFQTFSVLEVTGTLNVLLRNLKTFFDKLWITINHYEDVCTAGREEEGVRERPMSVAVGYVALFIYDYLMHLIFCRLMNLEN